jgi:hypothetical protein
MGERDELAEALDNVRTAIRDGEVAAVDASLPIVIAEYDRRGRVLEAATMLVGHYVGYGTRDIVELIVYLAETVEKESQT